ncbi:MAG: hypothetical protein R3200_06000 [Xanthomonadales bacterium]|nr:hypothetical protein [Xanthomonadales bacterium]
MESCASFSVFSGGDTIAGYDRNQVGQDLIRLFRIPQEKVDQILSGEQLLKKGMDRIEAEAFQRKLNEIGVAAVIREQPGPAARLELEPMEGEEPVPEAAAAETPGQEPEDENITCPKCGHEQPKAEQCMGCGVYFHKLQSAAADPGAIPPANSDRDMEDKTAEDDDWSDSLKPKALLAAAGAALLGALVWKFIAVAFDYELAVVAWAIGGGIGIAAAAMGSRGQLAGVVCGLLVVFSIFAGKYMAAESFRADLSEMIMAEAADDGLRPLYEELIYDAEVYVDAVNDDASLRTFMVDHNYVETASPNQISDEDIELFKEYNHAQLMEFAAGPPSYEEWSSGAFQEFAEISSWEIVKDGLGFLDLLFLALGVGTAFRLGSQRAV